MDWKPKTPLERQSAAADLWLELTGREEPPELPEKTASFDIDDVRALSFLKMAALAAPPPPPQQKKQPTLGQRMRRGAAIGALGAGTVGAVHGVRQAAQGADLVTSVAKSAPDLLNPNVRKAATEAPGLLKTTMKGLGGAQGAVKGGLIGAGLGLGLGGAYHMYKRRQARRQQVAAPPAQAPAKVAGTTVGEIAARGKPPPEGQEPPMDVAAQAMADGEAMAQQQAAMQEQAAAEQAAQQPEEKPKKKSKPKKDKKDESKSESKGDVHVHVNLDGKRSEKSPAAKDSEKKAGMPFTEQNRPEKVKEIYRALERDKPNMPAEMKARIASRKGKKSAKSRKAPEHGGPKHKAPLTAVYTEAMKRKDKKHQEKEASSTALALRPNVAYHKVPEAIRAEHLRKYGPRVAAGLLTAGALGLGARKVKQIVDRIRSGEKKPTLSGRSRAAAGAALGSLTNVPFASGAGAAVGAKRGHRRGAALGAQVGRAAAGAGAGVLSAGLLAGALHSRGKLNLPNYVNELGAHAMRGTFDPVARGAHALGAAGGAYLGHGRDKEKSSKKEASVGGQIIQTALDPRRGAAAGAALGSAVGAARGAYKAEKGERLKGAAKGGAKGALAGGALGGAASGAARWSLNRGLPSAAGEALKRTMPTAPAPHMTRTASAPMVGAGAGALGAGSLAAGLQYLKSQKRPGGKSREEISREENLASLQRTIENEGKASPFARAKLWAAKKQLEEAKRNKENPGRAALLASLLPATAGAAVGYAGGKAVS